jgi:hypothetical protein
MLEQFDRQLDLSSVWRYTWIVSFVEANAAVHSNLKAAFRAFRIVSALRCATTSRSSDWHSPGDRYQ